MTIPNSSIRTRPELAQIASIFREKSSFQLASHRNPDGDAIGSLFALSSMLRQMGKEVTVLLSPADVADSYAFLLNGIELTDSVPEEPAEVFVALECPTWERIGKWHKIAQRAPLVVGIDHHHDNRNYAHVNLVAAEAASTTLILFHLAKELGITMDKEIAIPLYVGLVTDTGKFQYSNTDAESLSVASELASLGADPSLIFEQVYEQESPAMPPIMSRFLGRVVFDSESGIIHSVIMKSDLEETGAEMKDTENFIDVIRAVKGVRVAALFKEEEQGGWRVSLRSRGEVTIGEIATEMGGGGHPQAAGFSTNLRPEKIIEKVARHISPKS